MFRLLERETIQVVSLVFTLWNMWFINNASELSLYLTERASFTNFNFNAVYLSNHFLSREPFRHLKHIFIYILYFMLHIIFLYLK
jgi:hypothetical protein